MSEGGEFCQAHSGIMSKTTLLVWLLGILIVIGGTQTALLIDLKALVAGYTYRFIALEDSSRERKEALRVLEDRVSRLERLLEHK